MAERLARHLATANADSVSIFPEEVALLSEICRRIDHEQDGDLAWRKVANIEMTEVFLQPKELDPLHQAVSHNLLASTVAYINLRSGESATGVLVDIDRRTFLATTAHSIPHRPVGKLSVVGDRSTPIDGNIPTIVGFGRDDERDVAFLELATKDAQDNFGKSAIPLSRIHPCGVGQENYWTFVCGYPTQQIQCERLPSEKIDLRLFTVLCWGSPTLMIEHWDVLQGANRPPDPNADVFLPYPREDDVVSLGSLKAEKLVEPFGMSGGGYWQPKVPTHATLWQPENYSLIAIQSRWWGLGRYLQATQIIHWLRLLWTEKEELRLTLQQAFPGEDFGIAP